MRSVQNSASTEAGILHPSFLLAEGFFDGAHQEADSLPEGVIVSTKDKYGNTDEITCDGDHEFKKPLAVLVDGRSASASEIFSAAIQDYGVGTIVGTQTYGKGVVQQTIDLGDGTCMKITISEYYTPSGRSINGTGVTPDVEVEYEYDEDEPEKDNQLEKAIDTVNG